MRWQFVAHSERSRASLKRRKEEEKEGKEEEGEKKKKKKKKELRKTRALKSNQKTRTRK
jgi:hypothetical protein